MILAYLNVFCITKYVCYSRVLLLCYLLYIQAYNKDVGTVIMQEHN